MGILYIDEAGNSGIQDKGQPNLIYGGVYIKSDQWKNVLADYEKTVIQYQSLIYTKFNPPKGTPESFDKLASDIDFFSKFHFHAAEIINGKGLWGKLNNNQPYHVLRDLISIMEKHGVQFHAGLLDKDGLLKKKRKDNEKIGTLTDFKTLLPLFFAEFEKKVEEDYVVVIADGSPEEKEILSRTLKSPSVRNCLPETFIKKAELNPFLQLADAGLWIIQAFHRLKDDDKNNKAKQITNLYDQLTKVAHIYTH